MRIWIPGSTTCLFNRRFANEKQKEFQRGVLKMMMLHPQSNVLAECVFERMPLEAFVDAKKILSPENGGLFYDSLLSRGSCKFILNKFEKEEQLLRSIRKEYEDVDGTLPALSGVCEIVNRLFLEKMRNEIGEISGAGHFWRNDRGIGRGGERDWMEGAELEKVLRLLSFGEKKINLKEKVFFAFFER
ncbi:unnamed protein product [Oikopleura dioica]|uniref:Uncharacterized protein n=1 Tax=Oikopleura dioica TaxID=34765 RepID=E4Y1W8_OIKDI|nr:unnamed protein product [Oikopleura dioica]